MTPEKEIAVIIRNRVNPSDKGIVALRFFDRYATTLLRPGAVPEEDDSNYSSNGNRLRQKEHYPCSRLRKPLLPKDTAMHFVRI